MKMVQEIKTHKPRRIAKFAKFLRPNFDISLIDSLDVAQDVYKLNMEKYAHFLSQTLNTEFFDASLKLQN